MHNKRLAFFLSDSKYGRGRPLLFVHVEYTVDYIAQSES